MTMMLDKSPENSEKPPVSVEDIEVFAEKLDVEKASAIYAEHGCLIVRGLLKQYLPALTRDIEQAVAQAIALMPEMRHVPDIGWYTPDNTLWIPAPPNFPRDKQIMVAAVRYKTSGAFLASALDTRLLDLVEAMIGPDVELFMDGQCLYKEPVGGHPKNLHQDSAYFEHKYEGPVAVLNYAVDTNLVNGALYVVPGSHRLGQLTHIDTFSHLGLDPDEWPWERALPITGEAGDSIFFHYKCIHGSQENHSTGPRPVFIHRYRRPDDYVTIGGSTVARREEAEKLADEAKKQNQEGFMVRGFRRYDAAR